jgi:hypothetical protein
MSLPKFVTAILSKKFTDQEVELISKHWNRFSQMSLSNSMEWEFIAQGRSILALIR